MLKKVLFISLILCVSGNCFAKKPNNSSLLPQKLPKTVSYSDGFKLFWKELDTETRGLKSLSEYVPSNTMKKTYLFVIMPQGQHGIEGFIQVMPHFDAWAFEELEGYLTYFQEGVYQFKIPIESLVKMLDVKGIIQIDIPRKQKK